MPENANPNEVWEHEEEKHLVSSQPNIPSIGSVPPSILDTRGITNLFPDDKKFIEEAQWAADQDVGTIEKSYNSDTPVIIDDVKLDSHMEELVRKILREIRLGGPPPISERKRLTVVCSNAYLEYFTALLNAKSGRGPYIASQEEVRLMKLAKQDKEEAPSDDDGEYDIRDIAIVRALQVLNISLDTAKSHLADIHKFANRYQYYYSNPREEVMWPF
jgi:hypothetical protein